MKNKFRGLVVLMCAVVLTGCASSSSRVITRRNSPDAPTSTDGIVLATHPHPRAEEQRLNQVLTELLKCDGPNARSSSDADYVLAYWIEESWDEVIPASQPIRHENPEPLMIASAVDPTQGRSAGESFHSLKDDSLPAPYYVPSKGVKLTLYSNRGPVSARLAPVWEGYIDLGSAKSPAHLKATVQNLLRYFGKDFVGRIHLQK